jgi:hypothetical protein
MVLGMDQVAEMKRSRLLLKLQKFPGSHLWGCRSDRHDRLVSFLSSLRISISWLQLYWDTSLDRRGDGCFAPSFFTC